VRFAIQTPQYRTDLENLLAVWRAAERLGFRSAWLMDHLYPILVPPAEPMLEAWTTLAALAARTEQLRVGVLVSANTFRHPALLARMAATVDQLSGGRLEVGLGAAWCREEHEENGVAFPSLRARLDMLDESCSVLRALWSEPSVTFAGRHYVLRDARCAPKPYQARLPLLLGGQGERRALRIVARHADRWNASGSAAALAAKVRILHEHCAALGRDPATIALTVRNDFLLTDDAEQARAAVARLARFTGASPEAVRPRLFVGDRAEVVERIAAFAAAGFDECILALAPPYDGSTVAMLERFAADVVPQVESAQLGEA
jgi:F420-dependent oxidoreductase-like protein